MPDINDWQDYEDIQTKQYHREREELARERFEEMSDE